MIWNDKIILGQVFTFDALFQMNVVYKIRTNFKYLIAPKLLAFCILAYVRVYWFSDIPAITICQGLSAHNTRYKWLQWWLSLIIQQQIIISDKHLSQLG